MGIIDQFNHLVNFVAPAAWVAVLLAVITPFFMPKRPAAPGIFAQAAINFVAGVLALGVGLWFFGRDGKMASYAAMVLACSLGQLVGARFGVRSGA